MPRIDSRELRHFEAAWERVSDPRATHTAADLFANATDDDPEVALGGIGLLGRWMKERERELVPAALARGASWFDVARWLGRSQASVWEEYGARDGGPASTGDGAPAVSIFHIARAADWAAAVEAGEYRVSTLGRSLDEEGFIHCSMRHQVGPVAAARYAGETGDLVLLEINPYRIVAPVRWERPDGADESYPHVYGALPVAAVTSVVPFDPPFGGCPDPSAG